MTVAQVLPLPIGASFSPLPLRHAHIFNILQCPQFAFSFSSSFLLPPGTWDLILVKAKCSFSGCPSGHPSLQSRPSCCLALRQGHPGLAGRRLDALCLGRSRSAHCHAEAWLANAGLSVLLKGSELRKARVVSASTFSPAAGDPRLRQRLV